MKKTSTIFFFIIYLFSVTEAHQLLKLPIVFEHFKEHKKENKEISLLKFLDIHYLHGIKKDKDYDRDMELPFKTATNCIASISNDCLPLISAIAVPKPLEIIQNINHISTDLYIPSSYLSNIWQPPKHC